jgi:RNA recognition motif-containing protein
MKIDISLYLDRFLQDQGGFVNIYVGNLSRDTTNSDLQKAFEAFGRVISVNIVKDKFSGQSRGFGFVGMPSSKEAQAAIDGLNGKEFMGRALTVNEARPRPQQKGHGKRGGGGGRRRW